MSLLPRDLELLRLCTRSASEANLQWGPVQYGGWSVGLIEGMEAGELLLVVWRPEGRWCDWYREFETGRLAAVPGSADPSPMVAIGWAGAAEGLLACTPRAGQPGAGRSLQSHLFAPPRSRRLTCTGFGPAAGLAQVFACWAKESFPSRRVEVRSFAAPAVGIDAFERYVDETLDSSVAWVLADDLTVWAHADFARVADELEATGRISDRGALRERLGPREAADLVLGAGTQIIEAPPDSAPAGGLEWPDYLEASGDPRRYEEGLRAL